MAYRHHFLPIPRPGFPFATSNLIKIDSPGEGKESPLGTCPDFRSCARIGPIDINSGKDAPLNGNQPVFVAIFKSARIIDRHMDSREDHAFQHPEKQARTGSFLYRARVPVYLLLFLILWPLNHTGGPPLLSRLPVPPTIGHYYLRAGVLLCCGVYFTGIFFRSLGTAYIGRQKVWSPKIRTDNTRTTGPFLYLRHPVYAGSLLIILSLIPLCSLSGAIFLLTTAGLFTYYLARQEEEALFGEKTGKRQEDPSNRFWPKKGFWAFLQSEGFNKIRKARTEILFSEFYNLAFGTGFFIFALSLSVQAFWYAFLISLIVLTGALLFSRHRSASTL